MLRTLALVLVLVTCLGLRPAPSAQIAVPPGAAPRMPQEQKSTPEEIRALKQAQKELGKERYQQIRRDSEQLVDLANQLKRQVDTAGEHTLSLDVIKKAEAIEKLAKDVKNKMKG